MAGEEDTQNTTTDTGDTGTDFSSFWDSVAGASSVTFGADFEYPRRVVTSFGKDLTPEQRNAILKQIKSFPLPYQNQRGSAYAGEFLVNGLGQIVRAPYDPKQDSYDQLYGMSDTKRSVVLSLLQSRGFYGSSKPSSAGTLERDRTAFREFLQYANSIGRDWETALNEIVTKPGSGTGGGAKYRTTPKEDLTEYLRKASLDRLGRTMTKADIDRAVAAIQSQEASKGPQAPATSVMAEQQVVEADPNRDKSVRFRRAVDLAMGVLGE